MIMTANLKQALEDYRNLTLELNDLADTKIFNSVMGPYAEVLTCAVLGLTLVKSENQADYDATKGQERYQIKVRHSREKGNVKFENLRMNSDGTMKFDYLIAIVMDRKDHKITEAYKIPANFIETKIGNNKKGKRQKKRKSTKTLVLTKEMSKRLLQEYALNELVSQE